MKAAVHSVLLDPGFQVSTAGKEAQAVDRNVLEQLKNCSDTARAIVIDTIGALESCVANQHKCLATFTSGKIRYLSYSYRWIYSLKSSEAS